MYSISEEPLCSPYCKPRHSEEAQSRVHFRKRSREFKSQRRREWRPKTYIGKKRTPLKKETFWRIYMRGGWEYFEKGDSYGIIKLSEHFKKRDHIQKKI